MVMFTVLKIINGATAAVGANIIARSALKSITPTVTGKVLQTCVAAGQGALVGAVMAVAVKQVVSEIEGIENGVKAIQKKFEELKGSKEEKKEIEAK